MARGNPARMKNAFLVEKRFVHLRNCIVSRGRPRRETSAYGANGVVRTSLSDTQQETIGVSRKTGEFSNCSFMAHRDVYRKIDFIYDQFRNFTAKRKGDLRRVDWEKSGRRFATDGQTLKLNWPNRKTRSLVAVNHLCVRATPILASSCWAICNLTQAST